MSFKKKTSSVSETARLRLSGMKSINPPVNMGNGLDTSTYENKIKEVEAQLEEYNTQLSLADEAKNRLEIKEKELLELSRRLLSGVGAMYGYDSTEYEKAGGTRSSDRKKPVKRMPVSN